MRHIFTLMLLPGLLLLWQPTTAQSLSLSMVVDDLNTNTLSLKSACQGEDCSLMAKSIRKDTQTLIDQLEATTDSVPREYVEVLSGYAHVVEAYADEIRDIDGISGPSIPANKDTLIVKLAADLAVKVKANRLFAASRSISRNIPVSFRVMKDSTVVEGVQVTCQPDLFVGWTALFLRSALAGSMPSILTVQPGLYTIRVMRGVEVLRELTGFEIGIDTTHPIVITI
jgi:hypothetical protein